jgi:uncharacterized protein (TIGR02246 family)
MDRRQTILGFFAIGPLMSSEASVAMLSDASAKVQRLADRYAAAWNASDMDAMAKLYADDVHWVNIVGMHWQGKAQVDQAHRAYFDIMFKGVPLTLETVESVVALPGGAMVAVTRWAVGAFKTPIGEQMPPSRDRMSLVLIPKGDELVIAHGSNVQINEQAQRSDPIGQKPR